MAKDYEQALLGTKKTSAVYPKSISIGQILAATYVEMGNMEKAIKVVKEIFEIDPRFTLPGSRNVPFQRKTEREHYFLTLHGGLPE